MSDKKFLKIVYNGENRRVPFPSNYDELIILASQTFGLEESKGFGIYYRDDDNDLVRIYCQVDFEQALQHMKRVNSDTLKLEVRDISQKKGKNGKADRKRDISDEDNGEIDGDTSRQPHLTERIKLKKHNGIGSEDKISKQISKVHDVKCSGCQKQPIEGVRYKCTVCLDYDLCEKCEESTNHNHPFIKIRNTGQTPTEIKCRMETKNPKEALRHYQNMVSEFDHHFKNMNSLFDRFHGVFGNDALDSFFDRSPSALDFFDPERSLLRRKKNRPFLDY